MTDGTGETELPSGSFVPANTAAAAVYMSKGHYWNAPLYLAVTDGTLRIGLSNQVEGAGSWNVIDRIRIEYVGNTSKTGAYMALMSSKVKREMEALAHDMDYLELGATENYERLLSECLIFPVFR